MVEPASSSLKRLPLSTAWLLRRSRQPVLCKQQSYLLHHLTTWRERLLSSWARRVDPLQDGDRPPTHHLCCQEAQQTLRHCCRRDQGGKSQSTAAAPGDEWRPQSPLSGKKPEAKLQVAWRLRGKKPEEPKTSQAQAGRQLLTLKKLVDGYSAEATLPARRTKSRGDLRKHPQVEKRRRLNRSKNSLKEKHPRMMKEHQKCKKRIILV